MNTAIVERDSRHIDNASVPDSLPEREEQNACFEVVMPPIQTSRAYLFVKRSFDVVMSLAALLILAMPMALIALLIRLDSPGPAFFRQERLGKDGRPFIILKFRSMRLDAEKNGPQWADKDDPRCTRLGRILRKSRLDEIPQLWNILKGEMSFVGPRPERQCFYEEFETYIHGFSKRLLVKPGLTGYAQVNGGYELKPEEKIVYDIEYIHKQSVLMDLWCIFKTVKLVFTHEGAR
jgi:exopolysaccharide biosynthesis polyprenyl glycosylphosphotransferase